MNPNDTETMLTVLQVAAPAIPFLIFGAVFRFAVKTTLFLMVVFGIAAILSLFGADAGVFDQMKDADKAPITGSLEWGWNFMTTIMLKHGLYTAMVAAVFFVIGASLTSRRVA